MCENKESLERRHPNEKVCIASIDYYGVSDSNEKVFVVCETVKQENWSGACQEH